MRALRKICFNRISNANISGIFGRLNHFSRSVFLCHHTSPPWHFFFINCFSKNISEYIYINIYYYVFIVFCYYLTTFLHIYCVFTFCSYIFHKYIQQLLTTLIFFFFLFFPLNSKSANYNDFRRIM